MRLALHTAEIVAITALLLGLAALPAHGGSLGEVSAATGVHGTLARGGGSSSTGALKSVKSSLSKSTKSRDFDSGAGFGAKPSRSKSGGSRSSGSRSSSGGRGSWVSGSEVSRGGQSSAWAQGGNGWGTNGGGGGRRAPARRPRS